MNIKRKSRESLDFRPQPYAVPVRSRLVSRESRGESACAALASTGCRARTRTVGADTTTPPPKGQHTPVIELKATASRQPLTTCRNSCNLQTVARLRLCLLHMVCRIRQWPVTMRCPNAAYGLQLTRAHTHTGQRSVGAHPCYTHATLHPCALRAYSNHATVNSHAAQ